MTSDSLIELSTAVDASMATLIWLVQLVIYPAFVSIKPEGFQRWHHRYMRKVSFVVVPLILIQAACHGLLTFMEPSTKQWVVNAALLGAWGVTFTLSVPCHKQLQASGYQIETIHRLIHTNWLRTMCWTLVLIINVA